MATRTKEAPSLTEKFEQVQSLQNEYVESAKSRLSALDKERAELVKSLAAVGVEVSATKPKSNGSPKATRRRGGGRQGKRAQEFVQIVKEHPGITVTEVANKMAIKPNYLYRVAKAVEQKGAVVRDGRGFKVA